MPWNIIAKTNIWWQFKWCSNLNICQPLWPDTSGTLRTLYGCENDENDLYRFLCGLQLKEYIVPFVINNYATVQAVMDMPKQEAMDIGIPSGVWRDIHCYHVAVSLVIPKLSTTLVNEGKLDQPSSWPFGDVCLSQNITAMSMFNDDDVMSYDELPMTNFISSSSVLEHPMMHSVVASHMHQAHAIGTDTSEEHTTTRETTLQCANQAFEAIQQQSVVVMQEGNLDHASPIEQGALVCRIQF